LIFAKIPNVTIGYYLSQTGNNQLTGETAAMFMLALFDFVKRPKELSFTNQ